MEEQGCRIAAGVRWVQLTIDTPDGAYELNGEWLLACDGANSDIRQMMNLRFDGELFGENSSLQT